MTEQNEQSAGGVEIFRVRNRFQKQASRKGGISRDEALANGQAAVDELEPEYLAELDQDIRNLEAAVVSLRSAKRVADAPELEVIYARAKRLRDLGKTFGYHLVTEVSDLLCELVYRTQHDGHVAPHEVETCFQAIRLVGARDFKGSTADQADALLSGLHRVVDRHQPVKG